MNNIYNLSRTLKKINLSQSQIDLINTIEFEKSKQTWTVDKIKDYIDNQYPLEILVNNYNEICKLGKDSSSLKSYIIRYGEELGQQLFTKKTAASTVTKTRMIEKYGEEKAKQIFFKRSGCIESYILRYGEEEGLIRWDEYLKKRTLAYKRKRENGHQYPKYNKEYFIKLYGEEKGSKVYYDKINSQRYKTSKAYFIEKYGPIEGPIKCKESKDHGSLEYFTKKYGDKLGKEKHINRCIKIANTAISKKSYSQKSQDLFNEIKKTISDLFYYGENELVWGIPLTENMSRSVIRPDLFYRGKVIEFNGDLFHANPTMFDASSKPHPYNKNITAKEIWDLDKEREDYIRRKGYNLLIIWESDWDNKKQEVIEKCIKFLMT